MMDQATKLSLEYDFYGGLLTERQSEVMDLYHEENLSLSEIAEELGISRQGVHDALKNAEAALSQYESKLALVERFEKTNTGVREIDKLIDELRRGFALGCSEKTIYDKLDKVQNIVDRIND